MEKLIKEFEKRLLESNNNFTTIQDIEIFIKTIIKLRALRQILRLLKVSDRVISKLEKQLRQTYELDGIVAVGKQVSSMLQTLKQIVQDKSVENTNIFLSNQTNNRIVDIKINPESLDSIKPLMDKVIEEWKVYGE